MRRNMKFGGVTMLFTIAQAMASESQAPEPPAGDAGLQEIVVTAQRREENAQRLPFTIEVLDSKQLSGGGVTTVEDLTKMTTGVEIGSYGSSTQIFIRGVGDFSANPLANPGVSLNIDQIYIARPDGVNGNFFDIARVEVLKGPQGTLYGRNANGGAINVITNEPEIDHLNGYASVEFGNFSEKLLTSAINLPTGEKSALRLAVHVVDRDGYLSDGASDDKEQGARIRYIWQPTNDVTFHINLDGNHQGGAGGGFTYLPRRPGSSPWESTTALAADNFRASVPGGLVFGLFPVASATTQFQSINQYGGSAQLDWNMEFATLTAISGFRELKYHYANYPGYQQFFSSDARQKSLEIRLANKGASSLTWVAGGYYFDEGSNGYGHIFESPVIQDTRVNWSPTTQALAAFGQATYQVLDRLRLIGGIRYTSEKATLHGTVVDNIIAPDFVQESFDDSRTFNATTWKAGLEFDLAEHSMLYATASTGFKAGGLTQTIAPASVYQPETLKAYELGSRNRFLANRLQVNLSAFQWKYRDLQDSRVAFDPLGVANFLTVNAGDATIWGGDLDMEAKITAYDSVSISYEYLNASYTSFAIRTPEPFFNPAALGCPAVGVDNTTQPFPSAVVSCAGKQLAQVPRSSGIVAYSHTLPVGNAGNLRFGTDVKFASGKFLATNFTPADWTPGYNVFNASLDYSTEDERYSVGAFIRNIGDRAYYTGGFQHPYIQNLVAASIAAPRTFGIRATVKFGKE